MINSIIKKNHLTKVYGSPKKDWFHSPKKDSFISWLKKNWFFLFFLTNFFYGISRGPLIQILRLLDLNTDAKRDHTVAPAGHLSRSHRKNNYSVMPDITRANLYRPYNCQRRDTRIQCQWKGNIHDNTSIFFSFQRKILCLWFEIRNTTEAQTWIIQVLGTQYGSG